MFSGRFVLSMQTWRASRVARKAAVPLTGGTGLPSFGNQARSVVGYS